MSNLLAMTGFGIGLLVESIVLFILLVCLLVACVRLLKSQAAEESAAQPAETSPEQPEETPQEESSEPAEEPSEPAEEEPAEEEPAEMPEESVGENDETDEDAEEHEQLIRSFYAKLVQASDDMKEYYSALKNELLRYKKCHARMSFKRETFRVGRQVVARMTIRGKTLCLYLALNAADFEESKYHLEDVSHIAADADTPALYRMRSDRAERYGEELIAAIFEKLGVERRDLPEQDFRPLDATEEELIEQGHIKIRVTDRAPEEIFAELNAAAEASAEDGADAPNGTEDA